MKITKSKIVSALRRLWLYSDQRNACKSAARISRGKYRCSKCKNVFSKIEIDHIKAQPKFNNWHTYITNLFDGKLVALCHECHKAKTAKENKNRKEN